MNQAVYVSICGNTSDTLPGRRPSDETNAADGAGQGALDEGEGEQCCAHVSTPATRQRMGRLRNARGGAPGPPARGDTLRGATSASNPIQVSGLIFNTERVSTQAGFSSAQSS